MKWIKDVKIKKNNQIADDERLVDFFFDDGTMSTKKMKKEELEVNKSYPLEIKDKILESVSLKKDLRTYRHTIIFKNCIFTDDIKLDDISFEQPVCFINCVFTGNCSFESEWYDGLDLQKSTFLGDEISFQDAYFKYINFQFLNVRKANINFFYATIRDREIKFDTVYLGIGKVFFDRIEMSSEISRISFISVYSEGTVSFNSVSFKGEETSFFKCNMHRLSFMNCNFNQNTEFIDSKLNELLFNNCINNSSLDLARVEFEKLSIYNMSNFGKISSHLTPKELCSKIRVVENGLFIRRKWVNPGHLELMNQFQTLKQNFANLSMYEEEDYMYIEYRREERKYLRDKTNKSEKSTIYKILYKLKLFLYDKFLLDIVGVYATSPTHILFSSVIFILLYSFLYMPFLVADLTDISQYTAAILPSIKLSVETFLTVGYKTGDSVIYSGIALFEVFSGLFMMTYFTSSFVRKVIR